MFSVLLKPQGSGVTVRAGLVGGKGGEGGEGGALGGGVKCTIIDGDFFFFYTSSDGASCPCALTFSDVMQIC